jgi:hypothetical protein
VSDDYDLAVIGGGPAGERGAAQARVLRKARRRGRVAVCHAFGFTFKRQVSDLLSFDVHAIPEVSCVGLGEPPTRRTVFPIRWLVRDTRLDPTVALVTFRR